MLQAGAGAVALLARPCGVLGTSKNVDCLVRRLVRERDAARVLAETAQRALDAAPAQDGELANGKRAHDVDVDMADAPNAKRVCCKAEGASVVCGMSASLRPLLPSQSLRLLGR